NRAEGPVEVGLDRDVARIGAGTFDLPLERCEPLVRPRQHRDAVSAAREAPGDGRPGSGSDAGDDRDGVAHAIASSTSRSRSLPKYISSPTKKVGMPKAPRAKARCVLVRSASFTCWSC